MTSVSRIWAYSRSCFSAAASSSFRDGNEANVSILDAVAKDYPFTRWLEEMGLQTSEATRKHLCQWWASLMSMAGEHGYVVGGINSVSRTTNLWKATGPLAAKMQVDPAAFGYLPALLINHPQEVDRVLNQLPEAAPFIEVLTVL